ncbi:unnamed protein product [Closterium sp. Naga37s-1]|nr:unnamed protein product [Closterium sp. Naga37s-1]
MPPLDRCGAAPAHRDAPAGPVRRRSCSSRRPCGTRASPLLVTTPLRDPRGAAPARRDAPAGPARRRSCSSRRLCGTRAASPLLVAAPPWRPPCSSRRPPPPTPPLGCHAPPHVRPACALPRPAPNLGAAAPALPCRRRVCSRRRGPTVAAVAALPHRSRRRACSRRRGPAAAARRAPAATRRAPDLPYPCPLSACPPPPVASALPASGEHLPYPHCPRACLTSVLPRVPRLPANRAAPPCPTEPGGRGGSCPGAGRSGASCSGQVQLQRRPREILSPQQLREWYAQSRGSRSTARCPYVIRTGAWDGQPCGMVGHTESRCFSCLSDAWRSEFGDDAELPSWLELLRQRVDIFALDYDAILTAMYALPTSAEGACYLCVQPDPGIESAALGAGEAAALGAGASPAPGAGEAAALGASESTAPSAGESALSGTTPAAALHTFTLDSGASRSFRDCTTLTPLSRPVAVSLADPFGGPVLAHSSTVLPCPAVPSGSLSGLHLPSFSTNLVSGAGLQDVWVDQFTPGVEGRQRAAPHSCEFPPTEAPLQTLHMDMWGPARIRDQGHERYFLLVVDDYSRYTIVFPLRRKGEVSEVLIDWIRAARRQLSESFGSDLPVLRLHSDRGGEFSSDLLRAFCRVEGIRQTFTLPASPQQNGIAERRIGMLNLQPQVSMPETTPALRWTVKVGDAFAFCVWGSRAFVRDLSADKLSSHAVPCVFLGFPPDAPGPPPLDPLPPQGPAPSGVSQVDAVEPVEVAVDSGTARGAEPERVEPGGAETERVELGGAEPGVAESQGAEPGGAESEGAEPGGAEPEGAEPPVAETGGAESAGVLRGAAAGGPAGGATGARAAGGARAARAGRAAGAGAARGTAGAGAAGGAGVAGPGDARTGGTGAAGPGGGARAGAAGGAGAGAAGGAGDGAIGAAGASGGPTGAGAAGGTGVGAGGAAGGAAGVGAAAGGAGAISAGSGGATWPRPYFVPLLQQVLGLPPSPGPASFLECPPPVQSQSQLQPVSPLSSLSPYTGPTRGLTERREPKSHRASPVRAARISRRGSRQHPPPLPGTHQMVLRPSTAPQRVPLPSPLASSLPALADPEFDSLRDASPIVTRLLATVVTDPSFESTAASASTAELVDFAAHCRLDYAACLVAESKSVCPLSVGGECALGTDVLEDRQEEFQCFAAALPHLVSMLLASEGDPDAPNIPTPRSYAEVVEGPYSSQWQTTRDAEMAS